MEELEIEKVDKARANISKEILLPYFLRHVCQLIKQAKEKKVSEKYVRIIKIFKDVIMKKEMDENIDAYEKQ